MKYKSRTYNSIKNIVFSLGNQIAIMFLNFFSRAIFIQVLGAEYLGINGLFSDILMMLSLADLGLGSAMIYSFYKPLKENDNIKIVALVNFYRKIYRIIALAVAIIGISLIPFLNDLVNIENPIENLKLYYILFLINSVVSYLFVYKSSVINADQKGYILSTYSTVINIIRIILQTIFLFVTKNYIIYLIIQIFSTFINNLFISYKADKIYPFLKGDNKLSSEEEKNIFLNIKAVFLYKISGVLINGTDNILISTIVGTVFVGYYSNYNMIISTISRFITTIFSSLNASIGNLMLEEDFEKKYEVFKLLQMFSFIIGIICTICLYILINDFIILWIGENYILDNFTLIAILANFYLSCVLPPIWSYREATGLFIKTKYVMLMTALINIILSVLLGLKFGIGGIILASALAKLSTYFWYEPILLFKTYFNESVKEYFRLHLINFTILLTTSFVTVKITKSILVTGWLSLILKAIIVFTIPTLICLCIFVRTKEFITLKGRIKQFLK